MPSVLLVHDNPELRDKLLAALLPLDGQIDVKAVAGGQEALFAMQTSAADVVVSAHFMEPMDGVALFRMVEMRHPKTIRLLIVAPDIESRLGESSPHHGSIAKPGDAEEVSEAVNRALQLGDLLTHEKLPRLVAGQGPLPALPDVYIDLSQAFAEMSVNAMKIGGIIARDPILSARLLSFANSAMFGLTQEIKRIETAVTFLGIQQVKMLTLSSNVYASFEAAKQCRGFDLTGLQRHASLTAKIAQRLLVGEEAATAYMAGMLHDVGKLVLASRHKNRYGSILQQAAKQGVPTQILEQKVLKADHAQVGAYLLAKWNLPTDVVAAVLQHHSPAAAGEEFGAAGAVHVADALAYRQLRRGDTHSLDASYLKRVGVYSKLQKWSELAEQVMQEGE